MIRPCAMCGKEFSVHGPSKFCCDCRVRWKKLNSRNWRELNRERISAYAKAAGKARYKLNKEYWTLYANQHRDRINARSRTPSRRAKSKQWRITNKHRINAQVRARRVLNRDRILARQKAWRIQNRAKVILQHTEWTKRNPDKCVASRNKSNERTRKETACLHDNYVRACLSAGTHVPEQLWPVEIVEAKRAQMKLKRKIKELWQNQKTLQNSETNYLTDSRTSKPIPEK